MAALHSIDPSTGAVNAVIETHSEAEVERRLQLASETFQKHRRMSFADRAKRMLRAAEILESEKDRFARLMVQEMGKPLNAAIAEALKCALACRYYAENAEAALADEVIATNASRSYVHYQPLGPVLAVMPWNFPFFQVCRFAAPALMAGNTALLKHASNVPQCALALEEIFRRAGFEEGVFQALMIGSDMIPAILDDPRVAAATLTGSEAAGASVASHAGREIKKTVLELGGSDPFIVMPSANLDDAVTTAVKARTINNGQSCIAAKRFIVDDSIYDQFERRFVEAMRALKVGDPMDPATDVGPLATEKGLTDLEDQVRRAVHAGAHVNTGGRRIGDRGYYYEPTVLTGITSYSPIYKEEVFGPVAMLFRVDGIDEAISIANDTPFGLGSSAWTQDDAERGRFIDEIESGQVFINAMTASDPRLPFGGVKRSGYGRELSWHGIREFVNVKTVWIK
jgi:succinate-semialdehyde dehydrogenase/glutarate-semialdehyde dehydrogenase